MKSNLIAVLAVLSLAIKAFAFSEPSIIPQPKSLVRAEGVFKLAANTRIYTDSDSGGTGDQLAMRLRKATGWRFQVDQKARANSGGESTGGIWLAIEGTNADLGAEGYELSVDTNVVVIHAQTQAGLFYGVQTLLELLPPQIFATNAVKDFNWEIPCLKITDGPRFRWRGLMLDVSRHFFDKEEVEKLLDVMALHKINMFHWHLTDDNGWRIEIKKYPKLTTVGAWRDGVGFGLATNSTAAYGPGGRYGGFYTQDDIREVVAYAAARHITVVPEIEMPGHALAALAAYPEFGTGPGPFVMALKGGVNRGVFSPAKEESFHFLQDVLTEVFQLFPGPYVHIGGDEVPPQPWQNDEACQALMKREDLKSPAELESWFIRRIEKFVNANGKSLIGWSEIAHGGLSENAVVMDWIGGGREAANSGHDVVMTPTSFCYFDFFQSQDHSTELAGFGGYLPLEKVYSFEPIPANLTLEMQKHILGGQGNLWTEYIPNLKVVEYMVFPRLSALAEVTWSPRETRDFGSFVNRLNVENQRLDYLGVNYRHYRPEPMRIGGWKPAQITNELSTLEWDVTKNASLAGDCNITFEYGSGGGAIKIASVALLENGKEISRETHDGLVDTNSRKLIYSIHMTSPKAGAKYTVRAQVTGVGGSDSTGSVFWAMKPFPKNHENQT